VPDDEVRTVSGDVFDGSGSTIDTGPSAQGPSAQGPYGGGDPFAGGDPFGGAFRVRTFRLSGPPGGFAAWVGVGLVALGAYLVLAAAYPAVAAAGSAVVATAGAILLVLGLTRRRGSWTIYVGAVVLAGGLAGVGQAAGLLPGGGWTTLAFGLAFLGLAGYRSRRGPGARPLAAVGAFLAAVGGVQAAGSVIPGFPSLGQLAVPLLLAGLGAIVIARALRRP
jgi:hypothetical protein